MKMTRLLTVLAIVATVSFVSCKPKDADIKTAIETKLKAEPDLSPVTVNVTDGVATLTGELKNDAAKSKVADLTKDVKGVKSVNDNTTVAPPPVVEKPVEITPDDPLSKGVMDATKDYPSVKASVNAGVITVTGTIAADKWKKLKMSLDGLHPKKVDGSALTIK
ncbi:MAG: BON domain-containing protein [Ferruginibacter sp.]